MFTVNTPKPLSLTHHNSPFLNPQPISFPTSLRTSKHHQFITKPISATTTPSTPPHPASGSQVYQPFHPPTSPLPSQFLSLDTDRRLEVLSNRLGAWYEYAPLIPSLIQQGFSHSSIEEATGLSGVEQNTFVVAAKVRDSLIQSQVEAETLQFFDQGGADLLYEIRLLNQSQRAAAARYMVKNNFDGRSARDLAKSIKDFPRRRGDLGWECFNYLFPGDCLAYMYFRQSREHNNPSDARTLALEKALESVETDKAKARVLAELNAKTGAGDDTGAVVGVKVPVVRMRFGEVADATMVVVLPVCEDKDGEKGVLEAPVECKSGGLFGVVEAEKGWKKWVVLPGWVPVTGLQKGVVISFDDARVLPWKVNRWYKEEPILVVADRANKLVEADDGFFLVSIVEDGKSVFKVERGSRLKETGCTECLGTVVLVVRPPKDDLDDQLADEDWE
ncbi:Rik1-associated factor 1 [Ranunculus cassubicifolius]